MTGKIKKVMDKGFGFIEVEGEEKDIFFHMSALAEGVDFNSLREGDAVEFETEETDKGVNAINVRIAE